MCIQTATRTAGPWAIGIETDDETAQVIAADGAHICYIECSPVKANAQFIVRACNAWDDPAALRARLAELEGMKGDAMNIPTRMGILIENGQAHEITADEITFLLDWHDTLIIALRDMVCAADQLTDGQLSADCEAEREFIAAHNAARAVLVAAGGI